jgi:type IV fimbrial biogenesis protein FimT|tara:strand:+ start:1343 stop:1879 length:537 start_codon:yes stop_codon:yes gene_type:complete
MTKKTDGWTLLEVMVVLAIAGITLSLAIPSFQGMMARNSQTTKINDFLVAINAARSEANKIGGTVSVQAVIPGGGAGADNEFGVGWCVVLGNPGNCDEPVIRKFESLTGDFTINSIDGEDVTSLQFDSLGALANTNNATRSFDFCTEGQAGRRVFITPIGRSKSHKPDDPDVNKQPQC